MGIGASKNPTFEERDLEIQKLRKKHKGDTIEYYFQKATPEQKKAIAIYNKNSQWSWSEVTAAYLDSMIKFGVLLAVALVFAYILRPRFGERLMFTFLFLLVAFGTFCVYFVSNEERGHNICAYMPYMGLNLNRNDYCDFVEKK